MTFAFFPHTGDIGVHLRAETLDGLFAAAAEAFLDAVTDAAGVRPADEVVLSCRAAELDLLLHDFLSELLFRFDARRLLLRPTAVTVRPDAPGWRVDAHLAGEALDSGRHAVDRVLKAVTYHELAVSQDASGWSATVVFDI